ncbi:MAG TPA: hypothetical protein VKC60_03400, partial [Opitutaceae bacterium]|nr:hypothetical protein [Opitutaceae bacterium]
NRFFKRLFGNFSPSAGDLVFSKTGELLGIMVNRDYCAVINNFLATKVIPTGDNIADQKTSLAFNELAGRIRALPFRLQ